MKDLKTKAGALAAAVRKHIWAVLGLLAVALSLLHPAFRQTGTAEVPAPTAAATERPAPTAAATKRPAPTAAATEAPAPTAAATKRPAPTAAAAKRPASTPVSTRTPSPQEELPPQIIDPKTDWRLRLIDYDHPLGESFVPEQLTVVDGREQVDGRVAPALKNLIEAARADGNTVYVCSGYRDYATQHIIYFDNHVDIYMAQGMSEEEAHAKARLAVNYPGCSEHQSGLSADILEYNGQPMEPYIGGSGLMLWLEEHCAEYGFVIRYPDGKTDITGVEYEPWHLRYVGVPAAAYMMDHGLCLEEFLALYD